MKTSYDAIIIGGGHNGLVAAAYLARAGKSVLVLERRHLIGGATVTEELFPGFKYSVCSYVVSLLRPEIIRELELPKYGLEILPLDSTFTPMLDGDYLIRWSDHAKTRQEIQRHSPTDAEAYDLFGKRMLEMAMAVKPIISMVPPEPTSLKPGNLFKLAGLGRYFQRLGDDRLFDLMKLMTMSSADYLDEWFETDVLKATLSASGLIGTLLGPRSPGTAYVMLHHYMGEIDGAFRSWGFAKGGTGSISNAIARSAENLGSEIRTEAEIARITIKNGRATGVALANGDEISARFVVSSLDPKRTFLKLIESKELDNEFRQQIERYKIRGSSGKVNLSLDSLPNFTSLPGNGAHLKGAISISPSIEYLERAYEDAKYGNFSQKPYMDIIIPSMIDRQMAPPGKHVMSIFAQFAPTHLKNGNWKDRRDEFGDVVINTLREFAPNLKDIILHRQILTPWDLEQKFGLTGGNIFHGDLSPDQLFFLRPVPGWARYRTPIRNFYMCGSGTHPGGGIMGAPGRLSALEILKDWK